MTYGNGARTEYVYYSAGALSKISHFANGGTLFGSVGYEFDLAGNVTKAALDDGLANTGKATVTYQYDDLPRLTREYCTPADKSARRQYGYEYGYDAVGNRTQMRFYNDATPGWETTTYDYSPRNELTKLTAGGNSTNCYYDLRGNLTKKGSMEYYWSSGDKMTKVVNGETTVEYKYDFAGRRVAKRVDSGAWRWYFYDGLQVIAEGTGQNTKLSYTNTPSVIGGIISRGDSATTYTYHFDRLGNVMGISDTNGNPYAVYTMEAFGNVLERGTSSGYSSEHQTDPQPYHLTTKEYDPDTGLYYFNARWYDLTTARFMSRDTPLAESELIYQYCGNNPTSNMDPSGLRTIIFGGNGWQRKWIRQAVQSLCNRLNAQLVFGILSGFYAQGHPVCTDCVADANRFRFRCVGNCMEGCCSAQGTISVIVGGWGCDAGVLGYWDPLLNKSCEFHLCPLGISRSNVGPAPDITNTIAHELAHSCGLVPENYAYPLGDYFE